MRLRQSTIKTWMSCPLQAKFATLDRLPQPQGSRAAFGTIVHYALEAYLKQGRDLDYAIKVFTYCWENPKELLGGDIDHWNRYWTYGGLRQKGIEILEQFHERRIYDQHEVLAVEHPFLVPFGRHELTGTVDLVETRLTGKGKQILAVCDFKTSSRKPTLANLAVDVQFSVYCWASQQREFWFGNGEDYPPVVNAEWWFEVLQSTPRRGIWIHLMDGASELDAGARTTKDFERLHRVCDEIERAVEHDVFVPSLSGDSCQWCPFSDGPCPVHIPTEDERRADEHAWI